MARPRKDPAVELSLLEAGASVIGRRSLEGIRRAVAATDVAAAGHTSRDAFYRYFGDMDGYIERLAERLFDGERNGTRAMTTAAIEAYQAVEPGARVPAFKQLLLLNFMNQFSMADSVAGWVLHASAGAASSALGHPLGLDAEDLALAQRVAKLRADQYREMVGQLSSLVASVATDLDRQFVPGVDRDWVTTLLLALHDGLVLWRLVDPDAIDPEAVVDALFHVAWSFSEPVAGETDLVGRDALRRHAIGDAVIVLFEDAGGVESAEVAALLGEDASEVALEAREFVELGLRRLLELDLAALSELTLDYPGPLLLRTLYHVAEQFSGHNMLTEAAFQHDVATVIELTERVAACLQRLNSSPAFEPMSTAEDLVELARAGPVGKKGIRATLIALGAKAGMP